MSFVPSFFVAFLCQYQNSVVRWVDERHEETSEFFIKEAIAFFQSKNQFLVIGEQERTALTAEYVRFLGDFQNILLREPSGRLPNMLKEVLAVHQTQLE